MINPNNLENPPEGSIHRLLMDAVDEFAKLSPEEQKAGRAKIYKNLTGKDYTED